MTKKEIHINWTGPYTSKKIIDGNFPEKENRGIYQIYGTHPVYGSDKLLYIGRTKKQTFLVRLKQQKWRFHPENTSGKVSVYLGRLGGHGETPNNEELEKQIEMAERILIYAHWPAWNSDGLNIKITDEEFNVHIFNWEKYENLLPEVSGRRWSLDEKLDEGYITYGNED